MSENIVVVSQPGCGHCDTVKDYLKWKGKPYKEEIIGETITAEEFWKKYPEQAPDGTPITFVNGEYIYDVIAYFESGLEI